MVPIHLTDISFVQETAEGKKERKGDYWYHLQPILQSNVTRLELTLNKSYVIRFYEVDVR